MDIFVKNFPFDTTEEELKGFFSDFGIVQTVKIIKDKYTNQSKGFAFVDINFSNNAIDTIRELNGKDFKGRILTVNKSEPRTSSRSSSYKRR